MKDPHRPYVICHMMSTIDGKITSGDDTDILDAYFDLYTKTEDMLPPHTGWMCGRVTMMMFSSKQSDPLPLSEDDTNDANDYVAPHDGNLYMFGIDTKGTLRWDSNTIKLTNIQTPVHLVIVTTTSTPNAYRSYLKRKQISYIIAGTDDIDFNRALKKMKTQFSVDTLLLEGGGLLNGSVMHANLIDEISLLMTPSVINRSRAPSVFERKQSEPLSLQQFSLTHVQKIEKDTLWLRWQNLYTTI